MIRLDHLKPQNLLFSTLSKRKLKYFACSWYSRGEINGIQRNFLKSSAGQGIKKSRPLQLTVIYYTCSYLVIISILWCKCAVRGYIYYYRERWPVWYYVFEMLSKVADVLIAISRKDICMLYILQEYFRCCGWEIAVYLVHYPCFLC
jgi:hypothetical protein